MPYKNREDLLANKRRYYRENPRTPEQKAALAASARRRWAADPIRARDNELRKRYGFSLAGYEAMYAKQNGRCALCDRPYDLLHVDHDHESKRVRGLLCSPCNRSLGQLGDTSDRLARALAYVLGGPRG